MKFANTVGASIVYIYMNIIVNLLNSLKEDKAILQPILDKWMAKEVDLELIYLSQEEANVDATIKDTYELVKGMSKLVERRVHIERKANLYRKEYADQKLERFLGRFVNNGKLKDKEVWFGELGHNCHNG